jgi:hypothetical protein
MADPMIRNVLNNFQENPKQAQEDMKDPSVVRGARLHDQRRTLAFRTPCNRARSLPSRGVAQRAVHCSSSLSLSGVCMVRWGAGREAEQAHCGGCAQDWLSLPPCGTQRAVCQQSLFELVKYPPLLRPYHWRVARASASSRQSTLPQKARCTASRHRGPLRARPSLASPGP